MRKSLTTGFLALMMALPAASHAQEQPADPNAVVTRANQTLLNISATERAEVPQDLLIANLRYEYEGKDARAVQTEINKVMKAALEKAKTVKDVTVTTEQYYVYPYDPEPPKPLPLKDGEQEKKKEKIWRGNQSLQLESKNSDALLTLAGELQDLGLLMNGLTFTLSPEKAETVKDSLMEAALVKLKARAERAAKALGRTQTELVEVAVDTSNNYYPQPVAMRAMAMDSSGGMMEKAAPPVAEPGETEITLTVSARALLKP